MNYKNRLGNEQIEFLVKFCIKHRISKIDLSWNTAKILLGNLTDRDIVIKDIKIFLRNGLITYSSDFQNRMYLIGQSEDSSPFILKSLIRKERSVRVPLPR